MTNRRVADGFAVVQEYEQSRNGQVTFRGYGVFWFDPARDEYVMHWWDSMGSAVNEFRGRLDGNRLTLAAPMPGGGQSRTSWMLTGPDGHDFLMEVSPDGQTWHPAMEGTYRRRAEAPVRRAAAAKKRSQPKRRATAAAPAPKSRKKSAARPAPKRRTGRTRAAAKSSRRSAKRSRR